MSENKGQLHAGHVSFAFNLESYVIEVHHLEPLSATGERETKIEMLISLCPTCHRIAHLRSTPYSVEEIKGIRGG
ncbi:MAG: HNH endonuclease [Nitrosomonadales bacterium]|nr:HNH endonuclease [Nitrosomonadales bacterium]